LSSAPALDSSAAQRRAPPGRPPSRKPSSRLVGKTLASWLPRDDSRNQDNRSVRVPQQPPCNPNTVSPYQHDVSTPSTTSLVTNSSRSDTYSDLVKDKPLPFERRDSYLEPATSQAEDQPEFAEKTERKMHQTSSRLLRMTDDDRPFTRVSRFPSNHCDVTSRCLLDRKYALH
jgi:hypothetical protein